MFVRGLTVGGEGEDDVSDAPPSTVGKRAAGPLMDRPLAVDLKKSTAAGSVGELGAHRSRKQLK
jgi:hypothetical protein